MVVCELFYQAIHICYCECRSELRYYIAGSDTLGVPCVHQNFYMSCLCLTSPWFASVYAIENNLHGLLVSAIEEHDI